MRFIFRIFKLQSTLPCGTGKLSLIIFSLLLYGLGGVVGIEEEHQPSSPRKCRALQRAFLRCYCHLKSRDTVTLTNHPSLETGRPGGNGLQTSTDRTNITQFGVNQHF